jgi:hypothetical protein
LGENGVKQVSKVEPYGNEKLWGFITSKKNQWGAERFHGFCWLKGGIDEKRLSPIQGCAKLSLPH